MKRQAIHISLEILEKIKKIIEDEIVNIQKVLPSSKIEKEKMAFQFNIINYPTQWGKRKVYMSDTWQFEKLDK